MDEIVAPAHRVYRSSEQVEQGLRTIIAHGGSHTAAANALGLDVEIVRRWKVRNKERYAELEREMGPELEAQAVQDFQGFLKRSEEAKRKALQTTVDNMDADARDEEIYLENMRLYQAALERGDADVQEPSPPSKRVRDAGKTLQHIAISQGIAVQKILELTGRPTQVVQHTSMNEALARLKALGAVVEGVATDITDVLPSDDHPTVSAPVAGLPREATAHGPGHDHQAGS